MTEQHVTSTWEQEDGSWSWSCVCQAAGWGWAHEEAAEEVAARHVAPVDWPPRFRAAAEVAAKEHHERAYGHLRRVASWLEHASPDVVEAIERALLGEGSA